MEKGLAGELLPTIRKTVKSIAIRGDDSISNVPKKWKVVLLDNTTFGTKATLLISEEGLNFFLSRSDKPKALPLQKWIAGELLPVIRKR
jgi:prophage antirepressor-like protein